MLSPELKILCSLAEGSINYKPFKALELTTGLSATWLSKKLRSLANAGLVRRDGRFYTLTKPGEEKFQKMCNYAYPLFLMDKASLFSERISKIQAVESIVLFGSVARGRADAHSDLDLFIIIEAGRYSQKLENTIRKQAYNYNLFGEVFIVDKSSFLNHLKNISPPSIIFGVLEGYEILFDRHYEISHAIHNVEERVRREYEYVREVRVWLKRR